LTATRNLIVPTANKFYAVRNATTGSQSVLVKTSAGTGVTLANGYTQLMYCDGTNVVLASVPINSSNGNVAVSGALAVTSNATVGGDLAVTGSITQGGGSIFPAGIIWEYGGSAAPTGWLLCDGSAISRTTYSALFAVLGTAYGSGDGSTTFNLPDKRGKFGVGVDGTYTRGSTGGAASGTTSTAGSHDHTGLAGSTTLTIAQMPTHSHTATVTDPGHVHILGGTGLGGGSTGYSGTPGGAYPTNPAFTGVSVSNSNTGGGGSHNHSISTDGSHTHTVATVPPYLASNFIIKT
jgi:microcystin-dependent protein